MSRHPHIVPQNQLDHLIHQPQIIASWQPWWQCPAAAALQLSPQGTSLVQPCHDVSTTTAASLPLPPSEPLPTLCTLLPCQPHPSLPWQLLQLLYGYCLVVRVHLGDWDGDEAHAAQAVMAASPPLMSTAVPSGGREALAACMEAALLPPLATHTTRGFAVALLEVEMQCGDLCEMHLMKFRHKNVFLSGCGLFT